MDLQLKGKTALVTGASMGIGRAIAKGLAAEGVKLCIVARRRNLLDELAREIAAAGAPSPAIIEADVMPEGAAERLAAEAAKRLGHIDILANSAGGSQPALAIDAPEEKWSEAMTLNFIRVRQLTHAVLPGMIERGWGRVINVSSVNGSKGAFGQTNYSAAKAGMHGFTKSLALEVAKKGVTVNTISPGYIGTKMVTAIPKEILDSKILPQIPVGRLGKPEEVAGLIIYLCSEEAAFVNGANIAINGGQHMA